MSENMLEIRDLLIEAEIEGAWKPIVNSLSLNLKKGEIVGLIGDRINQIFPRGLPPPRTPRACVSAQHRLRVDAS